MRKSNESPCVAGLEAAKRNRIPMLVLLCVKTVVCQFVWTPLFFAPLGAIVYFWIGRDFSFRRFRNEMPRRFWRGLVLPNLLVNWVIWIPAMVAINALPTPLQVQMSELACLRE